MASEWASRQNRSTGEQEHLAWRRRRIDDFDIGEIELHRLDETIEGVPRFTDQGPSRDMDVFFGNELDDGRLARQAMYASGKKLESDALVSAQVMK